MAGFGGFNSSWQRLERNGYQTGREEDNATASSAAGNYDPASSDEQEIHGSASSSSHMRSVHHNRHTPYQVQELENYFMKNSNPDEEERLEIGMRLNIQVERVKFWFQNRRAQLKTQTKRHENAILQKENEELRLKNLAMQEAIKNHVCNMCGEEATIPDRSIQELLIKKAQLKDELGVMTSLFNQFSGRPSSQMSITTPIQRNRYLELASNAMEELLKLGMVNGPLWNKNMEGGGDTLNFEEYVRVFPPCFGKKPLGFLSEATRACGVVSMSSSALVEALLDADRWREMFVGVIGSCTTEEVICNGVAGSRNGALQSMQAQIQIIAPFVPVRVMKFIRFAKQPSEGVWVVVDLSIDAGEEKHLTRRCPSGCIIEHMPNGFSKVTWIEHTEYDELLFPQQYHHLITSGIGFGAQRWISALLRHCEGLRATTSARTLNHHLHPDTRTSLKRLAQHMTSKLCAAICLTGGQQWEMVAHAPGRPRIMARKCITALGEPSGVIMGAAYSVFISAEHRCLFDMLLRKDLRHVWDVMCHKMATRNMVHFPLGQDETGPNCISILSSSTRTEGDQVMVLQETASDMTGSLIVFATVDIPTVSLVMNGGDSSCVSVLPLGLSIVPGYGEGGELGSLVTMGFHILQKEQYAQNFTMTETINTINDLVSRTVLGIKEIGQSSQQRG